MKNKIIEIVDYKKNLITIQRENVNYQEIMYISKFVKELNKQLKNE